MGSHCCNSGYSVPKPYASNISKFPINNSNSHIVIWFWLCYLTLLYSNINNLTWSNSSPPPPPPLNRQTGDHKQRPINLVYLKSAAAWPAFTVSLNWVIISKFLWLMVRYLMCSLSNPQFCFLHWLKKKIKIKEIGSKFSLTAWLVFPELGNNDTN